MSAPPAPGANARSRIAAADGTLYVSGVDPKLIEQLRRTGRVTATGPVQVEPATEVIGESTRAAYAEGQAWLIAHTTDPDDEFASSVVGSDAKS